jgi:hypothetical protein
MLELISTDKIDWKKLTASEQKEFDVYAVNLMLGTNKEYIDLVNIQQMHYNMPKQQVYTLYQRLLPNKRIVIFYDAKKKKESKKFLEIYAKNKELGIQEVSPQVLLLSLNEKKEFLTRLGYDKKEIEKIIK